MPATSERRRVGRDRGARGGRREWRFGVRHRSDARREPRVGDSVALRKWDGVRIGRMFPQAVSLRWGRAMKTHGALGARPEG